MQHWQQYIELVTQQVVPALGCTEPVTVALACSKARELLGSQPEQVSIWVTPNLYKNAMGVMVPGTGKAGLHVAAAAGLAYGESALGLEVLKHTSDAGLNAMEALLQRKCISVAMESDEDVLKTRVVATAAGQRVELCIAGTHTRFEYIKLNDEIILQAQSNHCLGTTTGDALPPLSVASIVEFAEGVELERIAFIQQAAELNQNLAEAGLSGNYGLALGASLQRQIEQGLLGDGLLTQAMKYSAAASDARMGGAALPAMSNSGSGNQGIAATMPVVAFAKLRLISEQRTTRALMLSHLLAIYVKSQQNKLSALCAATTASMGACAAITWLLGGELAQIHKAINAMVGDISGVFCDGAKAGCAMKVSTGTSSAIKSAVLALEGNPVTAQQGIVFASADDSIAKLGEFSRSAMLDTDQAIIDTMQAKQA